jgi:hypothetical protein
MNVRTAATALALNRMTFGARFVLQPEEAGRSWIGKAAASRPSTKVFAQALGARDLALGIGALVALRRGDDESARAWMAGHTLADGTDLAATLAARDALPTGPFLFAMAMAGASTAIGAWSLASLGRD